MRDLLEVERNAARYLWLRNGNAYYPEEQSISGGDRLDEAIDREISREGIEDMENLYRQPAYPVDSEMCAKRHDMPYQFTPEQLSLVKELSADPKLYVSTYNLITYCPECNRYFDTRVGCPCDVAFTLRTEMESKGVDCNTALLAQEILLSISEVTISTFQDMPQKTGINPEPEESR